MSTRPPDSSSDRTMKNVTIGSLVLLGLLWGGMDVVEGQHRGQDLDPGTEPQEEAAAEILPRGGPPGTTVAVRGFNLPPITPVHIAFGGVGLGFESLAFVLTTSEGLLEESVEVPPWAHPQRIHRFLIFDLYFERILARGVFHVTDSEGKVVREGEVTHVGATCSAVTGTDEDTYFLVGDVGHLSVGDEVIFEGLVLDSSECGEGIHVQLLSASRASGIVLLRQPPSEARSLASRPADRAGRERPLRDGVP